MWEYQSLLSGVMVSVIANLDIGKTDYVVSWLSGKVSGGNWQLLAIMAPLLGIIWGMTIWRSYRLNMMMFSQETSIALGLNLKRKNDFGFLHSLHFYTHLAFCWWGTLLLSACFLVTSRAAYLEMTTESSYLLAC